MPVPVLGRAFVYTRKSMEWILASASPRRKQLLKEVLPAFSVIPATGEERALKNCTPTALVQLLATQKAEEVALLSVAKGKGVIGADTVVAFNGEVLGKPKDEKDAVRMLSALSGNRHSVHTGICLILPNGKKMVDCVTTEVVFMPLSQAQILAYVQTGSPMDKAGAYGIQDGGLVESIEGSFSNVVGLPVERLKEMIKSLN